MASGSLGGWLGRQPGLGGGGGRPLGLGQDELQQLRCSSGPSGTWEARAALGGGGQHWAIEHTHTSDKDLGGGRADGPRNNYCSQVTAVTEDPHMCLLQSAP